MYSLSKMTYKAALGREIGPGGNRIWDSDVPNPARGPLSQRRVSGSFLRAISSCVLVSPPHYSFRPVFFQVQVMGYCLPPVLCIEEGQVLVINVSSAHLLCRGPFSCVSPCCLVFVFYFLLVLRFLCRVFFLSLLPSSFPSSFISCSFPSFHFSLPS